MKEVLLTVDTSSTSGSVAISRGENLVGEVLLNVHGTHSDRLMLTIRQLLDDTATPFREIDAFGVVLGPGAFTGLRVGVGTVKGLSLASGKPALGVSSLQTLALQGGQTSLPLCAMLDARKNQVYSGLFHCRGGSIPEGLGPERVADPEMVLDSLGEGEFLFAGTGSRIYRTLIVRKLGARAHFLPWSLDLPKAGSAAVLALDLLRRGEVLRPEQLNPRYIRASEAEIAWAERGMEGAIEG